MHAGQEVLVSRVPAGFQAGLGHDAAVLPVDVEHAGERGPVGEREDVVDVPVRGVDAADGPAWEGVGHHDDEDLQRRDGGLVLAVADDPQVHPGGGGQAGSARVTGLEHTQAHNSGVLLLKNLSHAGLDVFNWMNSVNYSESILVYCPLKYTECLEMLQSRV